MNIIDSHHHLWKYDPDQYPWIGPNMSVLARDYLGNDLRVMIDQAGVEGTVVVQARQTVEETQWLLELAREHSFIRGVVGWVPLVEPDVETYLDRFADEPKWKAVRHVLQDEPDDTFMLRDDFNRGIIALKQFELVYDILIYARHLAYTIEFVDRHPGQPFVLDHIAKPSISAKRFDEQWANEIRELARRDHVTCKFSGVATEVKDPEWSIDLIRPYFETVLHAFGPDRLMFGTDWPVCLLRTSYSDWVGTVTDLIGPLSKDEQEQIMGLTAMRVYRLFES